MKKKILALALAMIMVASLAACGSSGGSGDSTGSGEDVTITIFNSKSEIQDQFIELADEYTETHPGVTIEVYYSSDTVSAHLATKYASNDPYTISMVDAKDIYISLYIRKSKAVKLPSRQGCYGQLLRLCTVQIQGHHI